MKTAPTEDTRQLFTAIAGILLRCLLFGVFAQLLVWVVVLLTGDATYDIYARLFDLSKREYDRFLLYSMTFMKVLNAVFFLMPFLAIKHWLRTSGDG